MIITNELGTPALNTVHNCDALRLLGNMPSQSVNCIVTSPPYFGLRDYGMAGQIGLEETPAAYVAKLVELFREARRVLRDDGTFWLNLGDTYTGGGRGGNPPLSAYWKQGTNAGSVIENRTNVDGIPPKSLLGMPWRVAFGLQDDGWILRSEIIWNKLSCMPESVTDRPTKSHETVFLFAKSQHYFYDMAAIAEPVKYESIQRAQRGVSDHHKNMHIPGQTQHSMHKARAHGEGYNMPEMKNKRTVWSLGPEPFSGAHFATFPTKLIEPMILAGCPVGGVVFDPFMGSGTTAMVARDNGRNYIGSELNPAYVTIAQDRLDVPWQPMFAEMLA